MLRDHPQWTYAALAPLYDRLVPLISSTARATGLAWLDVREGEHVLDAGVGTGLALSSLLTANPTGWTEGIDPSPTMLTRARSRCADTPHHRYGLRQGSITSLPYPPNTFDAIFAAYVLDVLPTSTIPEALQHLHRVLRPTGRLVIVSMAPATQPAHLLWTALGRVAPPLLGGDRPLPIPPLLNAHNFEVQRHATQTQCGMRSSVTKAHLASGGPSN